MKKIILIIMCVFLVGCRAKDTSEGEIDNMNYKETTEITNYVKIEMSNNDIMLLELYPDIAPLTVANFQKLVSAKFYDGLIFHRVIKDFMIQGGDPEGTGMGGADETIKGEFKKNGVENNLSHERGVLSMARSMDPDSASSQFFICHNDASYLDGSYAAFGKLIAGFETLDDIANTAVNGEKPINAQKMKSIRFVKIEK